MFAVSIAISGGLGAPGLAAAGTSNWLNYSGDTWSDPAAWDVLPSNTDPTTSLVFGQGATASTYTATDDLPTGGGTFTLNAITLNTTASDSTLGNITLAPNAPTNVLSFSGSNPTITMNGGGQATINSTITYAVNTTIADNGANTLTLGGAQTYNAGTTTTFAGPGNISAVGAAGVPLTFQNNSVVRYTGSGSLTLGPTAAGSAFVFGTNDTVTISNGLSTGGPYTGSLVLNDTGTGSNYSGTTVTLNFANYSSGTFGIGNMGGVSGTLNINAGAVKFAGSTAGDLFGNSLILNVAAGASFDFASNPEGMGGITGAGQVLLTGANVSFVEAGNRTFSGVFSGTGGVAQNVANVLTLSGPNIYSGTTTIEAGGTIQAGAANVLSPNSLVSIVALAGTLNLGGFSQTIGGLTGGAGLDTISIGSGSTLTINSGTTSETYNGGFTGSGNLSVSNSAAQVILGNNSYTGMTSVNGGTLRLLNAGNLPTSNGVMIGAGATLDGAFSSSASFTAPLSGSGTFVTEGPGTLTFSSSNPSAALSGLSILGGGITLSDATANANQIGSNPTLTLGSGTLSLIGNTSSPSSQALNGVTLQGGGGITVTSGSGATATIALGAITRVTGNSGTVNFVLTNTGTGTASITTTTANNSAGIIGDYATVNGTDWAVANGSGPTYTIGAPTTPATFYTSDTWAATNHTTVTTNSSQTSAATYDLRFNTAAADTVTLSGTNTLNGGGILVTPNVGAHVSTLAGTGTLNVPTGQDLILNQYNTSSGGTLVISAPIANATPGTPITTTATNIGAGAGSQTLTVTSTAGLTLGMFVVASTNIPATYNAHVVSINSPTSVTIAYYNASPPTAGNNIPVTFTPETNVVRSGPGPVTLSGTSTFAGLLTVNPGVLTVSVLANLGAVSTASTGSSSIYFNGGTIEFTASSFSPGSGNQPWIISPAGGTVQVDGATSSVTRTGYGLYGTGMLTKTGPGTLSIGSNSSPFTGPVVVNAGTLKFTSSQIGSAGNVTINSGGQYQINDNGAGTFGFAAGSILTLNGNGPSFGTNTTPGALAETVQSPGPAPTSTISNEIYLAADSRVGEYSATYSSTLYTGANVFSNPVIGPGALIKDGPGNLTLSNANNAYGYSPNSTTSGTVISQGTLLLGVNNAVPTATALQFGESNSSSTLSNNNSGTLDLKSFNQTVTGLTTQGTGTQQIINSGAATAASTLTVNYSGATPDTFPGQIGGGTAAAPTNANITVVNAGSGTLALTGGNTYSAGTTVLAGLLLANTPMASGSATGSGTIAVSAGASLGGMGNIGLASGNSVSIASNATLSPGIPTATGNTLTITGGNGVTFAANATLAIKTAATGTNDTLNVTGSGNLTLGGGDILALTSTAPGTFTIATVTGTGAESGVFGTVIYNGTNEGAATIAGPLYSYPGLSVLYNNTIPGSDMIQVTISSAPEPASFGILALGSTGLLARRSRRNRRKTPVR
jgi:autotransporter-associated beta strand protein